MLLIPDVDINYPEKRSIMIYLVYIYEVLSRDQLDLNDAESSDKHFRYSMVTWTQFLFYDMNDVDETRFLK